MDYSMFDKMFQSLSAELTVLFAIIEAKISSGVSNTFAATAALNSSYTSTQSSAALICLKFSSTRFVDFCRVLDISNSHFSPTSNGLDEQLVGSVKRQLLESRWEEKVEEILNL
ncbi:unnamed protein product [Hymenolepis diminuta]|uniref:Uncharacterized protein n=1 Tax=Hymenolepis diminuta TaxID=6216 RepID=A0A564YUL1_HYMDI|nr:unnamed protein product [Hymenolepis diminuta]